MVNPGFYRVKLFQNCGLATGPLLTIRGPTLHKGNNPRKNHDPTTILTDVKAVLELGNNNTFDIYFKIQGLTPSRTVVKIILTINQNFQHQLMVTCGTDCTLAVR